MCKLELLILFTLYDGSFVDTSTTRPGHIVDNFVCHEFKLFASYHFGFIVVEKFINLWKLQVKEFSIFHVQVTSRDVWSRPWRV